MVQISMMVTASSVSAADTYRTLTREDDMLRVTILHKDGTMMQQQFECAVVSQDHRGLHFYHYEEFYLKHPTKPFRTIQPADFFVVVSSRNE